MQVVTDVEARANDRVNEALSSVLESAVKTQHIVKSVVHSSNRKIAKISRRANKTIDKLQADSVTLQNQMKSTHAADLATLKMKFTSVLKDTSRASCKWQRSSSRASFESSSVNIQYRFSHHHRMEA